MFLKRLRAAAQILFASFAVWYLGAWLFLLVSSGEFWRGVSGVLAFALVVLVVVFVVLPTIPAIVAYKIYKKTVPPPKDDVERAARLYLGYPEFGGPFLACCFVQYSILAVAFALFVMSFQS